MHAQQAMGARGVNLYSLEKEKALGAQLAAEYRGQTRVLDSPKVLDYVTEIGNRLTQGSTVVYTFAIVDSPDTLLHEAAAFAGGYIFVPARLILAAQDENEFAGMLAHSVAHIEARHGTKEATRVEISKIATVPLIHMGGWAGYAMRQGLDISLPLGMLQIHRQLDLDADRLAASLMAKAGYDPEALARYIEREQPPDDAQPNAFAPLPQRSQRLERVRAAIANIPAATYAEHPGFVEIQQEVRRLTAVIEPPKNPPRLAR